MKSPLKNTEPNKVKGGMRNWTKVKINKWQGTVSFTNYNVRPIDNVTLNYDENFGKPWEVVYGRQGNPRFKRFKTKAQALKFARNYMRKNLK